MAKIPIQFTVNGEPREMMVEPAWTLLRTLRDELLLTGTKEGCSNGNCGACTVLVEGRSVNSCLVLAPEADGLEVTTVEGIARNGKLSHVQEAFVQEGGLQCGFCTPGFIISATALLRRNPNPTEEEIRLNLAGNLCRCTGYDKIIKAVMRASAAMASGGAPAT
ncbi:MAG: (2Fe-2S)-binding protein [SAR202 cluster bacterium]|nr:(2Fe-2S)-binding protein [SAR202 cluster bacterium]